MTPKTIEEELERQPFVPLRLHLVSGKTIDVTAPGIAWLLQSALLIFHNAKPGRARVGGCDVIAFRNIERIEQRLGKRRKAG